MHAHGHKKLEELRDTHVHIGMITFVYLYETFDVLRQQLAIFCFIVSLQNRKFHIF